jgi:hypothetical protein
MTFSPPNPSDNQIVWMTIGLGNQLKEINSQMWDAMMSGRHVSVVVDGETIKVFHGRALLPDMCAECNGDLK